MTSPKQSSHRGNRLWPDAPDHAQALVAMTFSTGIVDAVSYLGLHRVFTANMTGNIILLSLSVENLDPAPLTDAGLALAGFLLGAVFAARYLRRAQTKRIWPRESVVVLGITSIVMVALAITLTWAELTEGVRLSSTALLALAMGAQAATARRVAVTDMTTVVVTSALVGLASDSRLAGGDSTRWRNRAYGVLALLAGALLGGLILRFSVGLPLFIAALFPAGVALYGKHRDDRLWAKGGGMGAETDRP